MKKNNDNNKVSTHHQMIREKMKEKTLYSISFLPRVIFHPNRRVYVSSFCNLFILCELNYDYYWTNKSLNGYLLPNLNETRDERSFGGSAVVVVVCNSLENRIQWAGFIDMFCYCIDINQSSGVVVVAVVEAKRLICMASSSWQLAIAGAAIPHADPWHPNWLNQLDYRHRVFLLHLIHPSFTSGLRSLKQYINQSSVNIETHV